MASASEIKGMDASAVSTAVAAKQVVERRTTVTVDPAAVSVHLYLAKGGPNDGKLVIDVVHANDGSVANPVRVTTLAETLLSASHLQSLTDAFGRMSILTT